MKPLQVLGCNLLVLWVKWSTIAEIKMGTSPSYMSFVLIVAIFFMIWGSD